MSGKLNGKMALVTAAGQGIGRATAIAFADERAAVVATDINSEALAELGHKRTDIRIRRLDVLDSQAIEGQRKTGPMDADRNIRDLSGVVPDIPGQSLLPEISGKLIDLPRACPRCVTYIEMITPDLSDALALLRRQPE